MTAANTYSSGAERHGAAAHDQLQVIQQVQREDDGTDNGDGQDEDVVHPEDAHLQQASKTSSTQSRRHSQQIYLLPHVFLFSFAMSRLPSMPCPINLVEHITHRVPMTSLRMLAELTR